MRVFSNLSKLYAFVILMFTLTFVIVFKSSRYSLIIESSHNYVNAKPLKHLKNADHYNYYNNHISKSLTKWKILNDGTVIHLGNDSQSFNYTYVINNENICQSLTNKNLKLVIFVESKVSHFKRRQLIRKTWGLRLLQEALNYRIVFLLGIQQSKNNSEKNLQNRLQTENILYGDIVQQNFEESFKNVTLKSILSLKWYIHHCSNAAFSFKTDDDLYIHVPNLFAFLQQYLESSNNSILCHENRSRLIIRNRQNMAQFMANYHELTYKTDVRKIKDKVFKYLVNYTQLPGIYYPRYCAGFGYAFNLEVAKQLYSAAVSTPYFFIEDAFITGFCRYKANIDIINTQLLNLRPVLSPKQGICAFNSGRINSNEMSIKEIEELWNNINTQGFFCPQIVNTTHSVHNKMYKLLIK